MNLDRRIIGTLASAAPDALAELARSGHGIGWRDDRGQTLLHFAALRGDDAAVKALMENGADVFARNSDGETPQDLAKVFGHARARDLLGDVMKAARDPRRDVPLPFADLAALRAAAPDKDGDAVDYFYTAAQDGRFDQLAALALRDIAAGGTGFATAELLRAGRAGRVLDKLCETGQLKLLLDPQLWPAGGADFSAVWAAVPQVYKSKLDTDRFMAALRQRRMQDRMQGRMQDRRARLGGAFSTKTIPENKKPSPAAPPRKPKGPSA